MRIDVCLPVWICKDVLSVCLCSCVDVWMYECVVCLSVSMCCVFVYVEMFSVCLCGFVDYFETPNLYIILAYLEIC